MKRVILILFLSGVLAGTLFVIQSKSSLDSQNKAPTDNYSLLLRIKVENAEADAQKAMDNRDFGLMAIQGYATEVPGTNGMDISNYKIRAIEGTSDAWHRPEERALNENARLYAERYNKVILARTKGAASNSSK